MGSPRVKGRRYEFARIVANLVSCNRDSRYKVSGHVR